LLVTTGMDATAKIWRTSNQGLELLMTLYGHTAGVNNAAFSPDGERLATSGDDSTVRIWDISPKGTSEWFALSGDTDDIRGLAITKDGKRLIAAGFDTVYGYILDRDELVRPAESRLTHWLTLDECRQFLHQEECPPH
jgi:WD40 repeat protein